MKLLQRLKNLFLPEGEVSDGFYLTNLDVIPSD